MHVEEEAILVSTKALAEIYSLQPSPPVLELAYFLDCSTVKKLARVTLGCQISLHLQNGKCLTIM
jgi:hypothetical protein